MGKSEFIDKLQDELKLIPAEERENALKYYREYFDDAGVENEQKVLDELESPEVIAAGIKNDLGFDKSAQQTNETSNNANTNTNTNTSNPNPNPNPNPNNPNPNPNPNTTNSANNESAKTVDSTKNTSFTDQKVNIGKKSFPIWAIILIAILFIPVIIPAVAGIFGTSVGLVFGAIGIAIGFFAAAIGVIVSGVALAIWGIATIIAGAILNGLLLIGLGLFLIGLGLVFLTLALQFFIVWIPKFVKWIINLFRNGFRYSSGRKGEFA